LYQKAVLEFRPGVHGVDYTPELGQYQQAQADFGQYREAKADFGAVDFTPGQYTGEMNMDGIDFTQDDRAMPADFGGVPEGLDGGLI